MGESVQLPIVKSPLLEVIGRDNGFNCVGYRSSGATRDVGDESLADALKTNFANPRGGVVLSLPLRASNL